MADDTYTVTRTTTVAAAPAKVYEELVDFHRWQAWSPWEGLDPDQSRTYSGAASGKGAAYAWSGNRKVGQGSMEIVEATEPSKVALDLHFVKPFKADNDTWFVIEPDGTGSRVTWSMTGRKTLVTRVMGLFKSMDAMVGPDFEKGLTRLKATVEGRTG